MATERIVITGGTGLIGSHLTARLLVGGHKVTALARTKRFSVPEAIGKEQLPEVEIVQGEMTDPEIMSDLVNRADVIFHKAANQGIAAAVEHAQEFMQTNIGSVATLVDVLRKARSKPKLIVLGSSISVYGEGRYNCGGCGLVRPGLRYRLPDGELKSAEDWNPRCPECGGKISPVLTPEVAVRHGESVYAVTKKCQEDLLAGACNLYGISFVSLRYGTIIGAGQSWHNPFTRFLDLLSTGDAPTLHEDGCQTRDFIFVEDVVEANLRALAALADAPVVSRFFNAGSARPVTLRDFTHQLATLMAETIDGGDVPDVPNAMAPGYKADHKPDHKSDHRSDHKLGYKLDCKFVPGDVRHCFADCSKIERELGFRASTSLAAGLRQLVQWYVRKKGLAVNIPKAQAV